MSFAVDVKNELVRMEGEIGCCEQAELSALLRMGGTVFFAGQGLLGLKFVTENASVARKVLKAMKKAGLAETEVKVSRALRLKKHNSYEVKAVPAKIVGQFLSQVGILSGETFLEQAVIPPRKHCCRKAWLRGAFLGGGSVNRPEGEYHLELVTQNEAFATAMIQVLKASGLAAGLTMRKQDYVVYLKEGDAITSFLGLVGAHEALLAFENVRIVKEMRNQVNRLVNCETANLAKTVNAAVRQTESIRRIAARAGLNSLPAPLRAAAELRLSHPEATLQELVELSDGKISRSGMNHRLRALERIGEDLREADEA